MEKRPSVCAFTNELKYMGIFTRRWIWEGRSCGLFLGYMEPIACSF